MTCLCFVYNFTAALISQGHNWHSGSIVAGNGSVPTGGNLLTAPTRAWFSGVYIRQYASIRHIKIAYSIKTPYSYVHSGATVALKCEKIKYWGNSYKWRVVHIVILGCIMVYFKNILMNVMFYTFTISTIPETMRTKGPSQYKDVVLPV